MLDILSRVGLGFGLFVTGYLLGRGNGCHCGCKKIMSENETGQIGEGGGKVGHAKRGVRITRASGVLVDLMESGSQRDFIPDVHITAVIAAFDDEPASLRGSLMLAVPNATPTTRDNVHGWKGVRWREEMRSLVEDVTNGIAAPKRILAKRTGTRRNRRQNVVKRNYAALMRDENAVQGLLDLFEYAESGYVESPVLDAALSAAGYETLPDRGSKRGNMIRAAFPDVQRYGSGGGRWGLRLKEPDE